MSESLESLQIKRFGRKREPEAIVAAARSSAIWNPADYGGNTDLYDGDRERQVGAYHGALGTDHIGWAWTRRDI
jgi:hypothetical protein